MKENQIAELSMDFSVDIINLAACESLLPGFYWGSDFVKKQNDMHEDDGGVYLGLPNNGTDRCFIKEISDNWFYYELHWA